MSNVTKRSDLPRALANGLARDRVAHAYLLAGPAGSGKLAVAKTFAAALLCQGGVGADRPCGTCRSCHLLAEGSHPDLSLLAPEGDNYTIKQIRQLISQMAERPLLADRRVFVLADADRMRAEAANALLKTIEEPPPYGLLLLVTAHPDALLPTIVSRCQLIRFTPPPLKDASARLAAVLPLGLARFVARETGGDAERAAALVAEYDLVALREQAIGLLLGAREHAEDWLLTAAERAESYRREGDKLRLYLDLLADVCRDAMVTGLGSSGETIDHADRSADLAALAATFTADELADMIEACERTKDLIKRNVNTRLALEVLFLRLRAGDGKHKRGIHRG